MLFGKDIANGQSMASFGFDVKCSKGKVTTKPFSGQ
jgi:hypothetical protein